MNTMENPLKFTNKPRHRMAPACPCGKSNKDGKFVPFDGHEDRGYCHSCGETFLPAKEVSSFHTLRDWKPETLPEPSYIDPKVFRASLSRYEHNTFVKFLSEKFGAEAAKSIIEKYFISTTKTGGTIFWQIDKSGRIRSGKVIQYDTTGHRLKDVHPTWAHKALNIPDFNLRQCLFGEHLLREKSGPVAIVESEKTACIASLYFPDTLWLACGGKDGLKADKLEVLKGRPVKLFPDLDGYELWMKRAAELSPMLDVTVSSLLERNATPTEREGKFDLADYLLRFALEDFNKPSTAPEYDLAGNLIDPVKGYPITWDIPIPTPLERLTKKHPALTELISRFQLVEV